MRLWTANSRRLDYLRTVYFSLVQSHLQYSLINWECANNSTLHPQKKILNKIIKVCLFSHKRTLIDNLYIKFQVLKLSDLCKLEYAKFMYKFENNSLSIFFNNYFTKLDLYIHTTLTKKNKTDIFFQDFAQIFAKTYYIILGCKCGRKFHKTSKIYHTLVLKKSLKSIY